MDNMLPCSVALFAPHAFDGGSTESPSQEARHFSSTHQMGPSP